MQSGQAQQEINSGASGTSQVVGQAQSSGTYNQASNEFDTLSAQFSSERQNDTSQFIGDGCTTAANDFLNGNF